MNVFSLCHTQPYFICYIICLICEFWNKVYKTDLSLQFIRCNLKRDEIFYIRIKLL